MAALGLRCCTRAFFSCCEQGLLFVVADFSLEQLVAEHWLQVRGRLLWRSAGSGCAGLSCCSTRAQQLRCLGLAACGMWSPPDQGLSLCPLHWQVGSHPLRHQGVLQSVSEVCQWGKGKSFQELMLYQLDSYMETTLSLTLHHAQKVTEMDPRPKHKSLNYKAFIQKKT